MRIAVEKPGAIYTVGLNYDGPGVAPRPDRPLIFGKAASSIAGPGDVLTWDRELTPNVDAECELGVVVGPDSTAFGCLSASKARAGAASAPAGKRK